MFPLLTKLSQVCLHLALREQSWRGNISVAIRGEAPQATLEFWKPSVQTDLEQTFGLSILIGRAMFFMLEAFAPWAAAGSADTDSVFTEDPVCRLIVTSP